MNIVTAPLSLLAGSPTAAITRDFAAPPAGGGAPSTTGLFLKMATLITLIMIAAGIYLLIKKVPGGIVLEGMGYKINADTAGIALIVVGALFYLGVGKMIIDQSK